MIKEFIDTFKELRDEYLPFLTVKTAFFGILVFFLFLSIFTSVFTASHLRKQTENTSTKIEYVELGKKTIIKQKETIYLDDKDLTNIKFNSVVDSRCPQDSHCMVPGELTYILHYNTRDDDQDFIISTDTIKEYTIGDYTINVTSGEDKYIELIITKK